MDNNKKFCAIVRQRLSENRRAVTLLSHSGLSGQVMSILRQELDSMVRVIFLLSQSSEDRNTLISLTLGGQKWKLRGANITDRQMVDLADTLNGWTNSVYKFGCAFIHLSSFHEYITNDPFVNLQADEITSIKTHLHNYHGFPMSGKLTIQSMAPYLPKVFDKIADNLEAYVQTLETNRDVDLNWL